ncbi:MAG: CPBP family intramembrane metalloprotease [Candidatus Competibacteraceae bacterium]|nr:CPBP family intramembrane metalloprotease [Candidatus Competibacteraceae bacterium]
MNTETLNYLTLARSKAGWHGWRGIAALLLMLLAYSLITLIVLLIAAPFAPDPNEQAQEMARFHTLTTFIAMASILPFAWLIGRLILRLKVAEQSSAAGHFRWNILGFALLAGFVSMGMYSVGEFFNDSIRFTLPPDFVFYLAIYLTLLPLQSAAEEYIFRGTLAQSLGGLFASKSGVLKMPLVFLIFLISCLMFTFIHGLQQSMPVMAARFLIGVVFCYTIWKTQGLEAAIGLHIANNFLSMTLATLKGDQMRNIDSPEAQWVDVALQVGLMVAASWVVGRRYGKPAISE